MSEQPTYARQLLSTAVLFSASCEREQPYNFVWHGSDEPLHSRGLVVSAASVQQIFLQIHQWERSDHDSDRQYGHWLRQQFQRRINQFHEANCVLPVSNEIVMFAEHELPRELTGLTAEGLRRPFNTLERLTLATALVGSYGNCLDYIDFRDTVLRQRLGAEFPKLQVYVFDRPQVEHSAGVVS